VCIVVQSAADGFTARAGGLEGQVTLVTSPVRRLHSAGAYPNRHVSPAAPAAGSEFSNVVVFVTGLAGAAPPPARVAIRQANETFVPHMVAVTVGSTVEFPNDDPIFHNVFSLSRAATFDLGRFPKGHAKSRQFDRPGLVKLFCHLHSHMSAIVRVFDHPYFTVPDASGRFRLPGVPPGRYDVVAWHERAGEVTLPAVVAEGETASLAFSLPVRDAP
jgi:plastocyanin